MPDTTAKILAKGCNGTGITEDIAEALHNQLGKKIIAVVELVSEDRGENLAGRERVSLKILSIEPALDQLGEDHLRNVARALFMNRRLHSDDETLDIQTREDLEPTVEQVVAANPGVLPHAYVAATLDGECDVCGRPEAAQLHHVDVGALPDPFTVPQDDQADDEDEEPEDDDVEDEGS